MCVLSISFLTYHITEFILYKQCMKVEQTTLTILQNTFPLSDFGTEF